MKQLVADAEQYLHVGHSSSGGGSTSSSGCGDTDSQGGSSVSGGTNTDSESIVSQSKSEMSEMSSNYGKLKHSDSLLLLAQVI